MSIRPSEQAELRRSSFKQSVSAGKGRRRRIGILDGVRKEKRESALRKKRWLGAEAMPHAHLLGLQKKLANLTQLAEGLYSDDSSMQFEAAREVRKMLSIDRDPPIQEIVNSGVVPCLVRLLSREDYPQLQVKPALQVLLQLIHSEDEDVLTGVCWALYYLSRSNDDNASIQALIETGACPRLVKLLTHHSPSVAFPSLRVIGNIATGDEAQTQIF